MGTVTTRQILLIEMCSVSLLKSLAVAMIFAVVELIQMHFIPPRQDICHSSVNYQRHS